MRKVLFWGSVFICLLLVWMSRTSYIMYKVSVERAKSKYEVELRMKSEKPEMKSEKPVAPPKKSIDIFDWVLKAGGILAGLKTLLELVEKFRRGKVGVIEEIKKK